MSGSSLDGIDAALVEFNQNKSLLIASHSHNIPLSTKKLLQTISFNQSHDIRAIAELDTHMGKLFADAANNLLKKTSLTWKDVSAIGSHGQTIRHQPNNILPFTLQIGDPNIIATQTNITTVADFRRRDIAEGGQGAPLAPAFHNFLFADRNTSQWVVNIGGIANVTHLPANKNAITGFDTGPGNGLLDSWFQKHHNLPFDHDGNWASSGSIKKNLLKQWMDDDFFRKPIPKSTGRDYFNLDWCQSKSNCNLSQYNPQDIAATLTELTALSIAQHIDENTPTWVCGGGANNRYLMQRLQYHLPKNSVKNSHEANIDPNWIEACAFAWLAKQTIEQKKTDFTKITGAKKPSILGGIWLSGN